MKKFIAYFDYLGFKQFIENYDLERQTKIMCNNFRDMERAMGNGKYIEGERGLMADLSNSRINCINFSDTVVFYTNDDSHESLLEILDVAFDFNFTEVVHCFPVRGCIVYDELESFTYDKVNSVGGRYTVNSVYGKGLVKAHLKAEGQNWAGTVIDESVIHEMKSKGNDVDKILKPFAKLFSVPFKDGNKDEYALNLCSGTLNEEAYKNLSKTIIDNFSQYNKVIDATVNEKIENTLVFLRSFL